MHLQLHQWQHAGCCNRQIRAASAVAPAGLSQPQLGRPLEAAAAAVFARVAEASAATAAKTAAKAAKAAATAQQTAGLVRMRVLRANSTCSRRAVGRCQATVTCLKRRDSSNSRMGRPRHIGSSSNSADDDLVMFIEREVFRRLDTIVVAVVHALVRTCICACEICACMCAQCPACAHM